MITKARSVSQNPPAAVLTPIRVGMLGYGYWGPNLARNISNASGIDLVSVADVSTQRLQSARQAHPLVLLTEDFSSVLRDPDIDAIVVATPPATHFELVREALERGKHVLVTKPLTTDIQTSDELVRLADACGRHLMVDHTFLFNGAVRKIKQIVASGELGDVFYYDSVRINLGIFQRDANVIWDLAPHDISIMLHLINQPVRSVSAVGVGHLSGSSENIAYITLRFDSSLIAHFHVNWLAPAKVRRTIIGGSKKMVVYDDLEASEKVRIYDSGADLVENREDAYRQLVQYRTGDVLCPRIDQTEALAAEIAHFVNIVRHDEEPISDGAVGLEVVRIIDAAQRSLQRGGQPVEVRN